MKIPQACRGARGLANTQVGAQDSLRSTSILLLRTFNRIPEAPIQITDPQIAQHSTTTILSSIEMCPHGEVILQCTCRCTAEDLGDVRCLHRNEEEVIEGKCDFSTAELLTDLFGNRIFRGGLPQGREHRIAWFVLRCRGFDDTRADDHPRNEHARGGIAIRENTEGLCTSCYDAHPRANVHGYIDALGDGGTFWVPKEVWEQFVDVFDRDMPAEEMVDLWIAIREEFARCSNWTGPP